MAFEQMKKHIFTHLDNIPFLRDHLNLTWFIKWFLALSWILLIYSIFSLGTLQVVRGAVAVIAFLSSILITIWIDEWILIHKGYDELESQSLSWILDIFALIKPNKNSLENGTNSRISKTH